MDIKKQIGSQIKQLRVKRGLSQAELGEKINASKQYIYAVEVGTKTCSIERLSEIAEALDAKLTVRIS